MASIDVFPPELIHKLNGQEALGLGGAVIRNLQPARHKTIHREPTARPSIGRLDLLPAELLMLVLEHLDFSLCPDSHAHLARPGT